MVELSERDQKKITKLLSFWHDKTLYIFYLLPFTDNKFDDFSFNNVLDVHISKDLSFLYVAVKSMKDRESWLADNGKNFLYVIVVKNVTCLVFKIPDLYKSEIQKIIDGKISTLSVKSKMRICDLSGLGYSIKEGKVVTSHVLLQLLLKNNPFKELLAIYFSTPIEEVPDELIPPIKDDSDIYIENWMGS